MPDAFVDWIIRFAVMCSVHYPKIVIATAVVAAVMAAVLLILRQQVLEEESWLTYLGLAFAAFAVQYGLRAVAAWYRGGDYSRVEPRNIERFAQAIFSNLNTLFFLVAALALLYWLPPKWWRTRAATVLCGVFALSALAGLLLHEPWDRRLDGLLSAAVLALVSWAMFLNSGAAQRRRWALLNLVGGLAYALLNLVYAFTPYIVTLQPLSTRLSTQLQQTGFAQSPIDVLDQTIFALAFLLKFLLFFGALFVVMRCLLAFSPAVSRDILEPVKTGRAEFLGSGGIVRAMAESIGADAAALSFRLPGLRRDAIVKFTWTADGSVMEDGGEPLPRPLPKESTIGLTLVSADVVHSRNWKRDVRFNKRGFAEVVPGIRSFVNMPLLYHGAAIGCLNLEWRNPRAYTATDVQRVRQIADYVTPIVQTERWLRAIADLRERLQFYNFDVPERRAGRFIGRVVEEIHDVLAPMGTLLLFEFGFDAQWGMCIRGDAVLSSDDPGELRCCRAVEQYFKSMFAGGTSFVDIPLPLGGGHIGKIVVAARSDHDDLPHPSLTMDRKQHPAIGVLVKDALLDLHRGHLRGILHTLYKSMSAGGASESLWLKILREAVTNVGIRSVTVSTAKIDKRGRELAAGDGLDLDTILSMPALDAADRRLFCRSGDDGTSRAIVELRLPLSEETLYVEIDRAGFRKELDSELPWKVFFDRLADIADSALVRIQAIELESDAMQFEMNALLVHELRNPAEEFQQAVEWLDENVFAGLNLNAGDSRRMIVDELKQSALRFMELASAVVTPVVTDNRSSVPLREIRERIDRMYKGRLAMQGIDLSWQLDDDWVIGAPLHLANIVLIILVQNAREAILDRSGRIRLEGEVSADAIWLHIDDTGCGIPEAHRASIFKLGFTTKDRGSGRGLALAQRALHRLKGDLQLADRASDGFNTRFTVQFPRS